jgi:hypothetical protein
MNRQAGTAVSSVSNSDNKLTRMNSELEPGKETAPRLTYVYPALARPVATSASAVRRRNQQRTCSQSATASIDSDTIWVESGL